MRPIYRIAFTLLLVAPSERAGLAAEPDAPDALIGRAEAIRIAVQNRLSAKFTATSEAKKTSKARSSNIIRFPTRSSLWVDENGLTERGKAVMAEIEAGRRLWPSRLGLRAAQG